MYGQVGTVSYPTRALNTAAFGTAQVNPVGNNTGSANNANNNANVPKQRVFTGSVTKVQDNFGFVDEDVFFQTRFLSFLKLLSYKGRKRMYLTYRVYMLNMFKFLFYFLIAKNIS